VFLALFWVYLSRLTALSFSASCCSLTGLFCPLCFFLFGDMAPTEIYTLSLHDALPICGGYPVERKLMKQWSLRITAYAEQLLQGDRKSTRLNSSHQIISYAVFCLTKKIAHEPGIRRCYRT